MSWPTVPIKAVCLYAVDCPNRTAPIVDYDTPYKMLRTTNVRGGFVDTRDLRCVTRETYERWTRRLKPQVGDVILTREAPLGDVGRLTSDEQVFLGQRLFHYRANPEKLDSRFLAYVLQSNQVQGWIKGVGFGATVQHAKVADFLKIPIPLPPLTIQSRIGQILSTYDDLTENNRRRITLLEEAARQLYKEWFVRFRFPGHEHVKIIDGVPEGWERKTLRDVATLNYGKALKEETRIPGGVPVFGSSGIVGSHNKALVNGPGIILGRKGNVGSVRWSHCNFFPIDTVYFIASDQSDFHLYLTLQHMQFMSTDVAVPGLNREFAYSRSLIRPSATIGARFEEEVTPVFLQIQKLTEWNEKLAKARDLLLPKLMNGAIAA